MADIVVGCTDLWADPEPSCDERIEHFLARLPSADQSVVRVTLASALDSARIMLIHRRFHRDGSRWDLKLASEHTRFYRQVAAALGERTDSPFAHELGLTVAAIVRRSPL